MAARGMSASRTGDKTALLGKGDKTSLRATAVATLAPSGSMQTMKYSPKDRTLLQAPRSIETVWDEPATISDQARKLASFGKNVTKMQGAFEEVTRMKVEKKELMEEMHQHTLQKIENLRDFMEKLLAELAGHIQEFSAYWDQELGTAMDGLDVELRERLKALNVRYEALEKRARSLNEGIDEEIRARKEHIEGVLVPARAQVQRLEEELKVEHEIRQSRDLELRTHMDQCVKMLEATLQTESRLRVERHSEAKKAVFGAEMADEEKVEEDHATDRMSDFPRLLRRHEEIVKNDSEMYAKFSQDLVDERKHRTEGQDQIVSEIDLFIQRFQAHVLEEGEAGS